MKMFLKTMISLNITLTPIIILKTDDTKTDYETEQEVLEFIKENDHDSEDKSQEYLRFQIFYHQSQMFERTSFVVGSFVLDIV